MNGVRSGNESHPGSPATGNYADKRPVTTAHKSGPFSCVPSSGGIEQWRQHYNQRLLKAALRMMKPIASGAWHVDDSRTARMGARAGGP